MIFLISSFIKESEIMSSQKSNFNVLTTILILLIYNNIFSFGQNKVQYTNFSWKTLRSPHFSIFYHQEQGYLPEISFYWIENAYQSLTKDFQYTPKERIPLITFGDPNLFAQTNIISEILPEGVGGFTEIFKNRIVVPFNGSYTEFRHVLHHELTHAFCYSILYNRFGGNLLLSANVQVPLWFMEGLAEYLSSKWDIEADMFLMDQVINGSVPLPGPELDGYMAYKGGQSFLHYLAASRSDTTFQKLIREFKNSHSVDNCIKKVYGQSIEDLGKEWIQELKRNYWPEIGRRELPASNALAVTSHRENRDNYNLRPRISPDGSKIAFFSDRKDFSSIIITDKKGKILHTISQNGYGGYFETFHPFRSGLSWSPDGSKIAFVTKSTGSDEIRIVNIKTKKLVKKIKYSFTSISSPDWSKNGERLVFTAVEKGRSDIYIFNFASSTFNRVTDNILYESDPRFTPDSKNIIFSLQDTSGSSTLQKMPYSTTPSDIALIDLSTYQQKLLTSTPWNEKQPCISPDGKKCAFVSDRNGIDNLYIGEIDSLEKAKPLTDYIGGCSNPDWSNNMITFSLFQQFGWDIWLMDKPESHIKKDTLAATRWVECATDSSKEFFTKAKTIIDTTDKNIANSEKETIQIKKNKRIEKDTTPTIQEEISKGDSITKKNTFGINTSIRDSIKFSSDSVGKPINNKPDSIPQLSIPQPQPYRLSFSPDMVSVGLGLDTYYGYAGQWMLSLSDIMGDHRITLAGDIQGNFEDNIHLFSSYSYLKQKVDFAIGAYYSKDFTYANVYGDLLYHNTEYGGFFTTEYPFSLFSRLDFTVSSQQSKQVPVDSNTATIKTTMFLPSLSYVYDNILWGITGPINGLRASVTTTVSPPVHFLKDQFVSIEADIRTYSHIFKRFVWANRLFLGGSMSLNTNASARLYFLGGNENWLFYHVNLDEYGKNIKNASYSDFVTPFRGWDYIDISGSKVALLNSEFRFPFIKEISVVWPMPMQIRYISGALFTDIGNAWSEGETHQGIPLPDKIYGGIGFGLRANLGMFILRYDRGWPTDFKKFVKAPTNYFSLGGEF